MSNMTLKQLTDRDKQFLFNVIKSKASAYKIAYKKKEIFRHVYRDLYIDGLYSGLIVAGYEYNIDLYNEMIQLWDEISY